jgi:hypothetical protein
MLRQRPDRLQQDRRTATTDGWLLLEMHAGFPSYYYFFLVFFFSGVSSKDCGETYMIRSLLLISC